MDLSEEPLSALFNHLIRLHRQRASEIFAMHGLYAAQPYILKILRRNNGQSQNEFVEKLKLRPASISNVLKRMEKAGLIYREKDDTDHRITRVYLGEMGQEVLSEVDAAFETIREQWFKGFTAEEKILLRRFILQMCENLSEGLGVFKCHCCKL
ncbi:MAG: MarR family transcriptional regulator [Caldisericia bacterium]|nr:MarR family transcriptional regulator [Caldisericia bacterium]